jgi:hypothetical protein
MNPVIFLITRIIKETILITNYILKKENIFGHQWLTPVILVTQESKIRKIVV